MTTLMILLIIVLIPMIIVITMALAPYAVGMLVAVSVLVSVIVYFEWVLMGVLILGCGWMYWKMWESIFNGNCSIIFILVASLFTIVIVSIFLTIMVV